MKYMPEFVNKCEAKQERKDTEVEKNKQIESTLSQL